MSIDESADIKQARRWFAEELRHTAHVRSPAVVDAFATVPREHFAGPGPWRVLSPLGGPDYWTIDDADPRRLCHDVLVAIDEARRLNCRSERRCDRYRDRCRSRRTCAREPRSGLAAGKGHRWERLHLSSG